jgi:hypothetical protein
VIKGDGAGSEEDEGECEGGQSQGEFVSAVAGHPIVEVHLGDGDGQVDADGSSGHTGEEAEQNEKAAKELGKGRQIGGPGREPEAGDELGMVVESAENLVEAVDSHDGAEGDTHDKEREGLQAIEVAQVIPPAERRIAYRSGT